MNKQDVFDIIARYTREVVPGLENYPFQFTDSLKELGANSIDRSEILMLTMETLSLTIPLIEFAGAQNIGELAELFCDKRRQYA